MSKIKETQNEVNMYSQHGVPYRHMHTHKLIQMDLAAPYQRVNKQGSLGEVWNMDNKAPRNEAAYSRRAPVLGNLTAACKKSREKPSKAFCNPKGHTLKAGILSLSSSTTRELFF
ncbi:unnamed protein product [Protopolystoma xenopodis]|uniref:Uncharacterized protein n=1 Tax=Protopolystoma xenopodis TaxID=117903 RepID=A0A3S5B3C8_9PLAT|nr:unnamed protein product [Protopolystoma xenopodis]